MECTQRNNRDCGFLRMYTIRHAYFTLVQGSSYSVSSPSFLYPPLLRGLCSGNGGSKLGEIPKGGCQKLVFLGDMSPIWGGGLTPLPLIIFCPVLLYVLVRGVHIFRE